MLFILCPNPKSTSNHSKKNTISFVVSFFYTIFASDKLVLTLLKLLTN